jgi:CysZ protein
VQAYYAGYGNLDYFMDRRYTVKESINFIGNNKGVALGNGIGFLLLLAVPLIGVFLAPTLGVAAATLSGIEHAE